MVVVSPNPKVYVFELHNCLIILQGIYLPEIGLCCLLTNKGKFPSLLL